MTTATLPVPAEGIGTHVPNTSGRAATPEPDESETDAELCELVRRGRESLNALVERHTALVWGIVNRLHLPPQVDPSDLAQLGLMALARAAEKWRSDQGSKFLTYAYTCVRNAVRRAAGEESQKTTSLHQRVIDDEAGELLDLLPAPRPSEVPEEVAAAVRKLPELFRAVVEKHYGFEGEPAGWEEICTATGLTVAQAKKALELACDQLRFTDAGW